VKTKFAHYGRRKDRKDRTSDRWGIKLNERECPQIKLKLSTTDFSKKRGPREHKKYTMNVRRKADKKINQKNRKAFKKTQ